MKQPLVIIPPAQAEALYDAALEAERPGPRAPSPGASFPGDAWDDETPSPRADRDPFPPDRKAVSQLPKRRL